MYLLGKELMPEESSCLYACDFTSADFERDFSVKGGKWTVADGWLTGENRENCPGMAVLRRSFTGDVMLDLKAQILSPCTHDVNVMWNGSWNDEKNLRGTAYVAGLNGWWHDKVGFEKSPEYKLNAATPLLRCTPDRTYRLQAGSIGGHVFILVDGALVLELTDPDPIDNVKCGLVGFEAYCSRIRIRDFSVWRPAWRLVAEHYEPEF